MKLEHRRLSDDEVQAALQIVSGWEIRSGLLAKDFEFDQYQKGLVFASAVGYLADGLDHHPDIAIGYGKVTVHMSTHSTGGLSPYDFELARRIDSLVS